MNKPASSPDKKTGSIAALARTYSGPLTGVALSALSAWTIVIGLKGLAGFEVSRQSALADLLGIVLVVGVARWFALRRKQ
jgi:hypothetical protein